jgi:hypothetical protein
VGWVEGLVLADEEKYHLETGIQFFPQLYLEVWILGTLVLLTKLFRGNDYDHNLQVCEVKGASL